MSNGRVPNERGCWSVAGAQGSHTHARSPHTLLLWVDDEVGPDNAEVRLLELEGIDVSCASTAARGLVLARSGAYRGIVLDLRLPDASGLAVLAKLRSDGVRTPVMMLTGYGDFESARLAGYLGATGFKAKPLFGDELVRAVRALLETVPADEDHPTAVPADRSSAAVMHKPLGLATLLETLHRLRHMTDEHVDPSPLYGDNELASKAMLVTAIIRTLTECELQAPLFFACSDALRQALSSDSTSSFAEQARVTEQRLLEILAKPRQLDPRVAMAIGLIESDLANHHRPGEEEIARAIHVDRAHLGRLIHTHTGFSFREWRKGLCLKTGVVHLAASAEHVGQIACRILGYQHESQFDREFHEAFGVAPREFRRVCRACRLRLSLTARTD